MSSQQQQQQQQLSRPLLHSTMGYTNMYQPPQHPVTPTSMATPTSPQFPSSSFTNNPLSSFNMFYPSVQVVPGRSKLDITPPPTAAPPPHQSHNILAHMSSSPQLTKSCSFPPMDGQFASDHLDSLNNPGNFVQEIICNFIVENLVLSNLIYFLDYQFMGAPMHQRGTRFANSPALRTPLLIPRQPMLPRFCQQQWLQQQQPVLSAKLQKVRRQRSRQENSLGSSKSASNDSSAASSQSQTPTLATAGSSGLSPSHCRENFDFGQTWQLSSGPSVALSKSFKILRFLSFQILKIKNGPKNIKVHCNIFIFGFNVLDTNTNTHLSDIWISCTPEEEVGVILFKTAST